MDIIFESFDYLTNPDWIMKMGGLYLVLVILFVETGLFFGFFLPGDPLLFISGMIIASANQIAYPFSNELFNLAYWEILFMGSTIMGNFTGYWFGNKFGYLFINRKKDSWFLKRKHIDAAQKFYEKKGGFAITIARFVPIVRTFVPIIGGMVKMDFKRFSFYNILGAVFWVGGITTLGYALGENEWVNKNLEWTILGIVIVVTLPVIIKMVNPKKTNVVE